MFWMDEQLCSDLYLDGVVTMVDAKYCLQVCCTYIQCFYGNQNAVQQLEGEQANQATQYVTIVIFGSHGNA